MNPNNFNFSLKNYAVMTTLSRVVLPLLCATTVALSAVEFATAHNREGMLMHMLQADKLSLTDTQQAAIKTVISNHDAAMTADITAMKTARKNLMSYLKSGGADSAEIDLLTTATANAQKVLQTEQAGVFVEAYSVLTADQKTTLASATGGDCSVGHHWGH